MKSEKKTIWPASGGSDAKFHIFAIACLLFLWLVGLFPYRFATSVFSPTDPSAYPLAYNEDHYYKVLGAQRVWEGEIPMRDFRYIYGPLDQLLFFASGAFGQFQPAAFDAIALILVLSAYFFFYKIVSTRISGKLELYSVLLLFLCWDGKYFVAKGVQYAELVTFVFGFAAFYFLERFAQKHYRKDIAFAAAASFLAFLGKQEFAVAFALGIATTGILLVRQKKIDIGAVVTIGACMAAAYPAYCLMFNIPLSALLHNLIPPAANTEIAFVAESTGNSFLYSPLAYTIVYYALSALGLAAAYEKRKEDPFLPGLFVFSITAPFLRSLRRSLMGIYLFFMFVPAIATTKYSKMWVFNAIAIILSLSLFVGKTYIPSEPAYDARLNMVVPGGLEQFLAQIGPSKDALCIPYCSPILAGSGSKTRSYEWWTAGDFFNSHEEVDSTLCPEITESPPERILLHTLKGDKLDWIMDSCMKEVLADKYNLEREACYNGSRGNCVQIYQRVQNQ